MGDVIELFSGKEELSDEIQKHLDMVTDMAAAEANRHILDILDNENLEREYKYAYIYALHVFAYHTLKDLPDVETISKEED